MGHHFINHFQEADKCTLQGPEPHTMVQSSSSAMSVFQSLPTVKELLLVQNSSYKVIS